MRGNIAEPGLARGNGEDGVEGLVLDVHAHNHLAQLAPLPPLEVPTLVVREEHTQSLLVHLHYLLITIEIEISATDPLAVRITWHALGALERIRIMRRYNNLDRAIGNAVDSEQRIVELVEQRLVEFAQLGLRVSVQGVGANEEADRARASLHGGEDGGVAAGGGEELKLREVEAGEGGVV